MTVTWWNNLAKLFVLHFFKTSAQTWCRHWGGVFVLFIFIFSPFVTVELQSWTKLFYSEKAPSDIRLQKKKKKKGQSAGGEKKMFCILLVSEYKEINAMLNRIFCCQYVATWITSTAYSKVQHFSSSTSLAFLSLNLQQKKRTSSAEERENRLAHVS